MVLQVGLIKRQIGSRSNFPGKAYFGGYLKKETPLKFIIFYGQEILGRGYFQCSDAASKPLSNWLWKAMAKGHPKTRKNQKATMG